MFLTDRVRQKAINGMISWPAELEVAKEAAVTIREVDEAALQASVMPERYSRNLPALTVQEQYLLFKSRVGVVGCGGLGGYAIEELARMGIGTIKAIDFDVFEEHNLNRQLLSQPELIGCSKAQAAIERVALINPAVRADIAAIKLDAANGSVLLEGCNVVVDALDNISSRKVLAHTCQKLNIPMVHGAIGGWYGQVATQFPGENTVEMLYANANDESMTKPGMIVFLPAVVASLQVAEVVKIILNKGTLLRNKIMFINLLDMEMEVMELSLPQE